MNTYDIGDMPLITATFKTPAGAPVDPDELTVEYMQPDGTKVEYTYPADAEITRVSTGVYTFRVPLVMEGSHYYRVLGTGENAAAAVGVLLARKNPLA